MPLESPMLPPVRYVLTSAIITSPGVYRYQLVSIKEARAWLTHGPWVSRVGYPQIARYIARTLGVHCLVSRDITQLRPGDEGLVVRLTHRPHDPANETPEQLQFRQDWEIGLLTRFE